MCSDRLMRGVSIALYQISDWFAGVRSVSEGRAYAPVRDIRSILSLC